MYAVLILTIMVNALTFVYEITDNNYYYYYYYYDDKAVQKDAHTQLNQHRSQSNSS